MNSLARCRRRQTRDCRGCSRRSRCAPGPEIVVSLEIEEPDSAGVSVPLQIPPDPVVSDCPGRSETSGFSSSAAAAPIPSPQPKRPRNPQSVPSRSSRIEVGDAAHTAALVGDRTSSPCTRCAVRNCRSRALPESRYSACRTWRPPRTQIPRTSGSACTAPGRCRE